MDAMVAFSGLLFLCSAAIVVADSHEECVKGIEVPDDLDFTDWPELWRLTTPNPVNATFPNMADPVDPSVLFAAGVKHVYLDPTGYDYPENATIPWIPSADGNNDMALQQFRDDNDFQYADIVVVSGFKESFYVEHIHPGGDEIRYILEGICYFDIRDVNDEWVRMNATAGDFVEFPTGIEHRFTVSEGSTVKAMRLFKGSAEPDYMSVPRSEVHGNNTARNQYIDTYLCGIDPDHDHDHHHDQVPSVEPSASPILMPTSSPEESSATAFHYYLRTFVVTTTVTVVAAFTALI